MEYSRIIKDNFVDEIYLQSKIKYKSVKGEKQYEKRIKIRTQLFYASGRDI